MTKYETLYGHKVDYFPNERENIQEKLRLVRQQIAKLLGNRKSYSYEYQCAMHELEQARMWCEKILEDIES